LKLEKNTPTELSWIVENNLDSFIKMPDKKYEGLSTYPSMKNKILFINNKILENMEIGEPEEIKRKFVSGMLHEGKLKFKASPEDCKILINIYKELVLKAKTLYKEEPKTDVKLLRKLELTNNLECAKEEPFEGLQISDEDIEKLSNRNMNPILDCCDEIQELQYIINNHKYEWQMQKIMNCIVKQLDLVSSEIQEVWQKTK